jgi:hypothetical protein
MRIKVQEMIQVDNYVLDQQINHVYQKLVVLFFDIY